MMVETVHLDKSAMTAQQDCTHVKHEHEMLRCSTQHTVWCRVQVEMSRADAAAPDSSRAEPLHQTSLHAESSYASTTTPERQQRASPTQAAAAAGATLAQHSLPASWTAAAAGQGFSPFSARAEARSSAQTGPAGAAASGSHEQLESPRASAGSAAADTPETLHLKAMAAQAERLQQVWPDILLNQLVCNKSLTGLDVVRDTHAQTQAVQPRLNIDSSWRGLKHSAL